MVNGLPQEAKAPLLFSISVLRGVYHFVKMLTYEHCLLLIQVQIFWSSRDSWVL